MTTFKELELSEPILRALEQMGFEEATPIQKETIPYAMDGKDVIGQAQTGTGKTAAFGIPMLEKFDRKVRKVKGLIIAPTRELAIQVAEEINRIGRHTGLRALAIYGGQQMQRQIRALREGPQMVVATPGRLMDHMRRKTIRTSDIEVVVLDEADEMLNMGFIDDIRDILKGVPSERQTLLFSATMPREIRDIASTMMKKPEEVKVKAKEMTVENIDQYFMEVPERYKFDTLTNHLDIHAPELSIVFSRTKRRVDEIAEGLQARGFKAEGIHGDLTQGKRMSVLNKFKSGRVEVLVATDVAARGLDISGVTNVYNFDIPQDPESYVHRIGRTGRAGKKGEAISFITPREIGHLQVIQQVTKGKIKRLVPPTNQQAQRGQQQVVVENIVKAIEEGKLKEYNQTATELLEDHDSVSVISAALSLLTKERKDTPVRLTSIAPISTRNQRSGRGGKGGPRRSNNKRFQGKRRGQGGNQGGRNRKGNFQQRDRRNKRS